MAIEVKLPDLGDGIESADILDVLVSEGDVIEREQGVVEIETDKATVEVPSPTAGKVVTIHVQAGQTVAVGDTLVSLEDVEAEKTDEPAPAAEPAAETTEPTESTEPQETPEPDDAEQAAQPDGDAAPTPTPAPTQPPAAAPQPATQPTQPATQPTQPVTQPTQPTAAAPQPAPAIPTGQPSAAATQTTGSVPAGPAIRRFAREVGVDLAQVSGSGPGGRITREDVLEIVRRGNHVAQPKSTGTPATAVNDSPPPQNSPNPASAPAEPSTKAPAAANESGISGTSATDSWGPITIQSASKIRKTIAKKMSESWSTVPRVTNFDDADVTELEKIRQASKGDYQSRGMKLTSMPFVIKAVSMALGQHPLINASLDMEEGHIIYKQYVNVGIAVDTDRGLMVPALRNTDSKSIAEISKELAGMAQRVRDNDFSLDDLRGGTFTISNLGAIGGTYSTPIINVPEVAILLIGRSRKLPVVVDDHVAIRLMMPLSLSYDHRLVDGATAARFLNDVIGYLEAPGRLLLAP